MTKPFRTNSRIGNQQGFSLMEVMVAAGVMATLAVGMMSLQKNGFMAQKTLQAVDDARALTNDIATTLTSPTACLNTFTGLNPTVAGTTATLIKDSSGNTLFQTTKTYGNRTLTLNGIAVGGTGTDGKTGITKWVPVAGSSPTVGNALILLDWLQTGTTGNQGIGPSHLYRYFLIQATLSGANAITACTAVVSNVSSSGTGTMNYIPIWLSSTNLGNSIMYQNAGNLGVGTTTPGDFFHINASGTSGAMIQNPNGALRLTSTAGANWIESGVNTTAGSSQNLNFSNMMGSSTFMTITSAGLVGIGTTGPSYTLHTVGTVGTSGAAGGYYANDRSTANVSAFYRTGDITRLWDNTYGDVMAYNSTGDVGIGTTAPNANMKMEVAGEVSAQLGTYSQFRATQGGYGVMFRNDGSNFYLLSTAAADAYGIWNTYRPFYYNVSNGYVTLTSDANGSTGVGIYPTRKFQVDGVARFGQSTAGNTYLHIFRDPATGYMTLDTHDNLNSAKQPLLINPWGGYVVIGQYTAAASLTVGYAFNGNVHGMAAYGAADGAHYGVVGLAGAGTYYGALGRSDGYAFVGNGHTWIAPAYTSYAGAFASSSDRRLKDKIHPLGDALALIDKMQPVRFHWKDGTDQANAKMTQEQIGFIAQDVEPVLPYVVEKHKYVNTDLDKDKSKKKKPTTINEQLGETYWIDYAKIVPVALGGVKELNGKFKELKAAFEALTKEFASHKDQVIDLLKANGKLMEATLKKATDKLGEEVKHLNAQLEASLADMQSQILALRSASEEQKREIASLKSDVKDLKNKNEELARDYKALKRENDAIKSYLCGKDPKAALCH